MPAQTPADADNPTSPPGGDNVPVPPARPRSPWPAVDVAKIREVLARAAASTRSTATV